MAKRGTPIPIAMRLEVRRLYALGWRLRAIARAIGVDHHTVKKYAVSPKALSEERLSA